MSVVQKTLLRVARNIAEDRGLVLEKMNSYSEGISVVARRSDDYDSTGRWGRFVFPLRRIEDGEYRELLDEYRAHLSTVFGATPEEVKAIREVEQKELGKQKTPFRPGRRRVRLPMQLKSRQLRAVSFRPGTLLQFQDGTRRNP